ncbi:MAG: pyridoxamine 5'-phosphate oxidase family protein [Nitrospirota bacterium]
MKPSGKKIPDRISRGSANIPERLKRIDKTQPHAVLATDADGQPYASLIAYALTPDVKGILFATPKSTRKYRNILRNRKVALLIDTRTNTEGDYMHAEAVTILGSAHLLRRGTKRESFAKIFLRKHPMLKDILKSPGTALVHIAIEQCIHATRFQSVTVWLPQGA